MKDRSIVVNGVCYRWPERPVVVVCVDGEDPAYLRDALARDLMPNLAAFLATGFGATAWAAMPSFTNPNNLSIVTGVGPATHGISGNFYLDRETGREVPMTDPSFVRVETILAGLERRGARVAAISAKDKLRRMLGAGITKGIRFSSEKAAETNEAENGIADALALVGQPQPDVYSAELSWFVLEAGVKLVEADRADVLYLSLTDFVQHAYPPGDPRSDAFHVGLDDALGRLRLAGALVAITADHGMNDKARPDGTPNVIYVQDALDSRFGKEATRVVLPITDPYVAHHGALGAFVRVYLSSSDQVGPVIDFLRSLPGIDDALDREAACRRFELPPDREGDVVVVSDAATALGHSRAYHDLGALAGQRLRTHGGVAETLVPFILSERLNVTYAARAATSRLRNYHIFDFALNGT